MPWLETNPVDQRSRFIDAYLSGAFRKTELCQRFHISRRTGDKWIGRYDAKGRGGLTDQSRAPKHCPHRIADILTGGRGNCSIGCGRGIPTSRGRL
jgi:putative transposase